MDRCTTQPDVCIAGGGIIGLSLALELKSRGARVFVLEARSAMAEASTAAAGMLAADDPENPLPMRSFAALSLSLYPEYLKRIQRMSDLPIQFQTRHTLQAFAENRPSNGQQKNTKQMDVPADEFSPSAPSASALVKAIIEDNPSLNFSLIDEHSIDPRELAQALKAAVQAAAIPVIDNAAVLNTTCTSGSISITTPGTEYHAAQFVDCTGAWSDAVSHAIRPVKGQMLVIETPVGLDVTVRAPNIYLVPRLHGQNAGRTLIGATIEEAGFDKTVDPGSIEKLLQQACKLLLSLAGPAVLTSWAGLRPATLDGLPLIGTHLEKPHHFMATGHYRNGILLAPATAIVLADLIEHRTSKVDLSPFAPDRFLRH